MRVYLKLTDLGNANRIECIKILRAVSDIYHGSLRAAKEAIDSLTVAGCEPLNIVLHPEYSHPSHLTNIDVFNGQRNMYLFFQIEFDSQFQDFHHRQHNNNEIASIEDLIPMMKQTFHMLLNSDAPEVLQSASIFYNSIRKYLKAQQN